MTIENRIAGALAGMVLGAALGVPGELWPREKVRARFGHIDTFLDGPEDNIVACYVNPPRPIINWTGLPCLLPARTA